MLSCLFVKPTRSRSQRYTSRAATEKPPLTQTQVVLGQQFFKELNDKSIFKWNKLEDLYDIDSSIIKSHSFGPFACLKLFSAWLTSYIQVQHYSVVRMDRHINY